MYYGKAAEHKKTILAVLCITASIFIFSGCGNNEEEAPAKEETTGHYEAYYDLCTDYQEKYGAGEYAAYDFDPDAGDLTGFCVARLIDFDLDSTEELLVVYNTGYSGSTEKAFCEVWAWKDGEIVNVLPATRISYGTDVSGWLEIAGSGDELLLNIQTMEEMNTDDWLCYNGDSFVSRYRSEGDIYSDTGDEAAYYIDGEKVSEEEYLDAAMSEHIYDNNTPHFSENGEMFVQFIYLDESYANAVLDETEKTLEILKESSGSSSEASENTADNADMPENLPEFIFASGSGGWATKLTINGDGTFAGTFSDSDMGDAGSDYPDGTVYICNFSGKFTGIERVDDYTYSMNLENMELENEPGEEWIEDGTKYVAAEPYGMDNASDFFLYLPGKSVDSLPADYISWVMPVGMLAESDDVLPFYGLYNESGKMGFFSQD